jgi:DHA1 family inner membrane transport protein
MATPLALFALAIATFAIGTTEFIVAGLLPEISADLDVTIPRAGLLVTGYAIGVAIGGPILAILTNGFDRKGALIVLMTVFVAGHVLCAVAPGYGMLMTARVVASFCHGAFFGIASVVAVSIVPESRKATAVALVWLGLNAATIVGVPAGTAIGHAFGWRTTFWAVAAVGLAGMTAIWLWVPGKMKGDRSSLADEFRVAAKPVVLMTLALSVLVCGAWFSVFTYVSPFLTGVSGLTSERLPLAFLVFGVGGTIGMLAGARLADWNLMGTIVGSFAALVAIYVVLALAGHVTAVALAAMAAWGFFIYAPAAPIQIRVVTVAREAPNLASTLNQSAFNIGNAVGPSIGAAALTAGMNYADLPWIGAALMAAGVAVALFSARAGARPAVAAP